MEMDIVYRQKWLRIKEDGKVKWHKQQGKINKHRQSKEIQTQAKVEMEGIVGRLSKKNVLTISGKDITRESNQMNQTNDAEQVTSCNEIIEEVIVNRKHIAAVDGSMTKDSYQLFG